MRFTRACIPFGYAWSSPFSRWQGPLAEVSSLELAVSVTRRAMDERPCRGELRFQIELAFKLQQLSRLTATW